MYRKIKSLEVSIFRTDSIRKVLSLLERYTYSIVDVIKERRKKEIKETH